MPGHPDTGSRSSCLTRWFTLSPVLLLWALLAASQAQMTLDGSLGPRGTLTGPHYRIGAESGQTRGSNLFHSFGEFNVPTGGSATFTGPQTIANILSRVTGGQPSSIDGLLRSEIAGANLYLLNPSGVLFGPNASLDVSGSFHVSTADFLRFADGAKFFANLGQESMLTVAPPAAFGFLGPMPAPMTIQGSMLQVPDGKALSVVGGEIQIVGGQVIAPSGRIHVASLASPGEVRFSPLELAPDLQVDGFARLGRLALSQGARVNSTANYGEQGGAIAVNADTLTLTGGSGIGSGTTYGGQGGPVVVNAGTLTATGGSRIASGTTYGGQASAIAVNAGTLTLTGGSGIISHIITGQGGAIAVNTDTLTLTGGSRIGSRVFEGDSGGAVTVMVRDAVVIDGRRLPGGPVWPSGVTAFTAYGGDTGDITISAPTVRLEHGGIIATTTRGAGRASAIRVDAERLTITGGLIDSSTTFSGGILDPFTNDLLQRLGLEPLPNLPDISPPASSGRAGTIDLQARDIQLTDGAIISATSAGPRDAGRIRLVARNAFRSAQSTVTSGAQQAGGGDIVLWAGSRLLLEDSTLSASVAGGPETVGGTLTLNAPLIISEGSQISAKAFAGRGGTISLGAEVFLADPASGVSASSALGISGTVAIQAPVTTLSGTLAPLPQAFVSAAALLPARCATRWSGGNVSSLVLGRREGLPPEPSVLLSSPLVLEERRATDPAAIGAPPPPSPARLAFLADQEKALPRLGCPPQTSP
jgi:filamentous hemagglutinin family protein